MQLCMYAQKRDVSVVFYDKFIKECNKRDLKPSVAVVEMGFQKSVATRWKKGVMPTDVNIQRVADYFGISFDEMKDIKIEKPTVKNDDRHNALLAQLAKDSEGQELLEKFGQLSSDNRSKFLELIDLYLEAQGRNKKSS